MCLPIHHTLRAAGVCLLLACGAAAQNARQRAPSVQPSAASREAVDATEPRTPASNRELRSAYSAGIRHFNCRLSRAAAAAAAVEVIESGARYGIDARLLVALLAAEGAWDRLQSRRRGLRISGEPAQEVIARIARDISDRIRRLASANGVDLGTVKEAVLERERERSGSRGARRAAATTERALRLYRQLSGLDGA